MWANSLLIIMLFANQMQRIITKKVVGVTSVFNTKYNPALHAIKSGGAHYIQRNE
jgi:hypothetical protein